MSWSWVMLWTRDFTTILCPRHPWRNTTQQDLTIGCCGRSFLKGITSPNLLGIVLLSLGWLNFGVVVHLSEFKYLMSVNEVLQSIKCPINNIQSQFLTLLHFIQTQFNVR